MFNLVASVGTARLKILITGILPVPPRCPFHQDAHATHWVKQL
ncbi:hypothetical protein [Moorena sp. SIOASIH]|nr:hypothetical protein [Moorena sp. SIOASIH]